MQRVICCVCWCSTVQHSSAAAVRSSMIVLWRVLHCASRGEQMVEHEKMGTTLRVAGGWVRDKLVGQEQGFHQRHLSKVDKMDIDIALDNCMGGDFAEKLKRYLARVREFLFLFFVVTFVVP